MVIRTEWSDKLHFATQTPISQLIISEIQVAGALHGDDLGNIRRADLEALATMGLPASKGWLYPLIETSSSKWEGIGTVFHLGSYDSGTHPSTGEHLPEGPAHLFVAVPATGKVLKVSDRYGGYQVHVNTSLRRFVDMAWRYHHIKEVLFQMQHSGTDEIPYAGPEEDQAIKETAWRWAVQADPPTDVDPTETFWWGAIWEYL